MQVTVPLMEKPSDLKSRIFRLIGKPVWEDEANKQRKRFNEFIARQFAEYPLFDLARAESTPLDSTEKGSVAQSSDSYSLWPPYTRDGGHLSELGQRVIARAFAISLAEALEDRNTMDVAAIATAGQSPENSGKKANAAALDTQP